MKSKEELEAEAALLYPITFNMCAWRKARALYERERWVKEILAVIK